MGEQCRAHNLFRTLHAFGASFNYLGQKLDLPAGMAALEGSLDQYGFDDQI
jgi:alanine-glyoxylate transaminase/serine-glyoxylate transaminase/serine-pyruvate transaminase